MVCIVSMISTISSIFSSFACLFTHIASSQSSINLTWSSKWTSESLFLMTGLCCLTKRQKKLPLLSTSKNRFSFNFLKPNRPLLSLRKRNFYQVICFVSWLEISSESALQNNINISPWIYIAQNNWKHLPKKIFPSSPLKSP